MTSLQNAVPPLKIGLFGIGLDTYWDQFEGLEKRLLGYIDTVAQQLHGYEAEVVNIGLVDNTEKAFEAGHKFRRADVDLIFLYFTTNALSSRPAHHCAIGIGHITSKIKKLGLLLGVKTIQVC